MLKINDKNLCLAINRKKLSYHKNQLDMKTIQIIQINMITTEIMYNGTIYDGKIIKSNNQYVYLIQDCFYLMGNKMIETDMNEKMNKLDTILKNNFKKDKTSYCNNFEFKLNKLYNYKELEDLINNLPKLSEVSCLPMPAKDKYISTINSNNPSCMEAYKSLYKTDITFNELANEQSRKSISSYIEKSELDISLLSKKLRETQNNKHYMLYNAEKGEFALEKACIDDYEIESYTKTKNSYICVCKNGKKLNVLLRWKNGNGIAFPAFQISSFGSK
jgi:hypothetical protein